MISKMERVLVFLDRILRNCPWTSRNRTKKKLLHMAIRLIYMSKKTGTCFKPRRAPWKPTTKDCLMLPVDMPTSLGLQLECCRAVILFCCRTRVANTGMLGFMSICTGFGIKCYSAIVLFCQRTRVANTRMHGFVSICTGFGTTITREPSMVFQCPRERNRSPKVPRSLQYRKDKSVSKNNVKHYKRYQSLVLQYVPFSHLLGLLN